MHARVTVVHSPGIIGSHEVECRRFTGFSEKPQGGGGWINGGFFVPSPQVIQYSDGESTIWERQPMERLAAEGQLSAYVHTGFWQPMDTLRDKNHLEDLWSSGRPPWKIW